MSTVAYSVEDEVAHIVLSRPPVNALDLDTINAVIGALERAGADPQAGAVVLSSATPRRFCAGLDLNLLLGRPRAEIHALLTRLYVDLHDVQRGLGKPTIAAVAGAARGAGMTLAIGCDVVLCDEEATFGYPEIDVGLIPGIHFVHLPRVIGKHRAFELLFSGRAFDAAEVQRLGLVSDVAPRGTVVAQASRMAQVFAAKSPQVMAMARAAFNRAHEQDFREQVRAVVDVFCEIASTKDAQEGLLAFSQRRAPQWTARP